MIFIIFKLYFFSCSAAPNTRVFSTSLGCYFLAVAANANRVAPDNSCVAFHALAEWPGKFN